ncbi:hypothetical protein L484_009139 [Morus notabilis]|uniref:Uncharacterized protein n=1 Tax=Morus notabilis TaxID=981085 RepID=W9R5P8_9ROSA|nr:hypothetical protein L484_009139 [Morus notabilis]
MKAYVVLYILLASILFFPSSLLARELAAGGESAAGTVTPEAGNPYRRTRPCSPRNPFGCRRSPPNPGSSCKKYKRNCPPNSSP